MPRSDHSEPGSAVSVFAAPAYLASSFWPTAFANLSSNSTAVFSTKEVTVVGWIDKTQITFPQGSVNSQLTQALSEFVGCPSTLTAWANGQRVLITDDTDRQYANAFLLSNSANDQPPSTLSGPNFPSMFREKGNYRAFNDMKLWIKTSGDQITSAIFGGSAALGRTPSPCGNLIGLGAFLIGYETPDVHPDNGAHSVTNNQLHAFQLAEGRIGSNGQAVNRTLNWCNSSNCASIPASPTTPYVWAYPLFDAQGNYTMQIQIFPTYYIYENGNLVTAKTITQAPQETFIQLDQSSQVTAATIESQ